MTSQFYPWTMPFHRTHAQLALGLSNSALVDVGEWQSQKVTDEAHQFYEINGVVFEYAVSESVPFVIDDVNPNMPWAEDHFQERVSGYPYNPPPSAKYWPFSQKNHEDHTTQEGKFSHTYPERFWPSHAGHDAGNCHQPPFNVSCLYPPRIGVRYLYGELSDVVRLLKTSPFTRQAYLPVWFPEDTGAIHGQRVPCSLGYHFMIRAGRLNCTYLIRSCDFYRHFRDDVYMAARLMQWMVVQLEKTLDLKPGILTMHMMNLHAFAGDQSRLYKDSLVAIPNYLAEDGHVED